MSNKYTIEIRDEFFCFLKNGKLHREAGPAVFSFDDKEKYFMLQDKELYSLSPDTYKKMEDIADSYMFGLTLSLMIEKAVKNPVGYYLEGKEYDQNTWYYLLKKAQLNKELSEELVESNIKETQTKV